MFDPALGKWDASDYTKTIDAIDKYTSDATHTGKQKQIKDELEALINNLEKVEGAIAKKASGKRKIKPFIRKRTPSPAPPTVPTSALPTDPTSSVSVPVPSGIQTIDGIDVDTKIIQQIAHGKLTVRKSGYDIDDLKKVAGHLGVEKQRTHADLAQKILDKLKPGTSKKKLRPVKPVRPASSGKKKL